MRCCDGLPRRSNKDAHIFLQHRPSMSELFFYDRRGPKIYEQLFAPDSYQDDTNQYSLPFALSGEEQGNNHGVTDYHGGSTVKSSLDTIRYMPITGSNMQKGSARKSQFSKAAPRQRKPTNICALDLPILIENDNASVVVESIPSSETHPTNSRKVRRRKKMKTVVRRYLLLQITSTLQNRK